MPAPPRKTRKPPTASVRFPAQSRPGATIQGAFQPIEDLHTGRVVGFEALARLMRGGELLSPAAFMEGLSQDDLAALFREMLSQAIALRNSLAGDGTGPYVTVNVEAPLVLADDFLDLLHGVLDRHAFAPSGTLVLELLEGHATTDFARMSERLNAIRAMGIRIALDDIGSAYSSLITLRDLPVDIMKLDRSFARRLGQRPQDLPFVLSLQGLAHSIGKRLVVEGVETADIHDALRVLGVDLGQGYAIARPMPAEAVAPWLAAHPGAARSPAHTPTSLLGAYAGHLRVVEACRTLMGQPLPVAWQEASKDPHACKIGVFFDRNGLHETGFGLAHKRFHEVMALYETEPALWQDRADGFRKELESALADPRPRFRCEAVAA